MGNKIKSILAKKGKSQGWLSRQSGVDRVQVCKIIGGKIECPRVSTAMKIAKALGMKVEEIWQS